MPRGLKQPAKIDLNLASATAVETAFRGLRSNVIHQQWLCAGNVYKLDSVGQIERDLGAGGGGINSPHLAEFIAASVPLHCADGWTFLARSLSCYINGNPNQAAHFAYYAELRAAMAILAARGIGVFNKTHFVVTASGACQLVRGDYGTHSMVWWALEHWAQTAASGDALLDLFIVSRSTIRAWFQNRVGAPTAGALANHWLKEWGLDLNVLGTDHLVRNASSYRPNDFVPLNADAKACSDFLRGLWALLQPSTNNFEMLDRHLFRMLIRKGSIAAGQPADPLDNNFVNYVNSIISEFGITDFEESELRRFLLSTDMEPDLLVKAEARGPVNDVHAHERVMSRAALLLRVATGFTANLIKSAAFTAKELEFWTHPWGERRAFWSPGPGPAPAFADLWLDVELAVEDETNWITAQGAGVVSMNRWRDRRDDTIRPLTECDRVALWGMQP